MLTMIFAPGSPSLPTFEHVSIVVHLLKKYHAFYGSRRFTKCTFVSHVKGRTTQKAPEYGAEEIFVDNRKEVPG